MHALRSFVVTYLSIGEDPTDTVIRDRVWCFILRNKRKITETEADKIWNEEVQKSRSFLNSFCVLQ